MKCNHNWLWFQGQGSLEQSGRIVSGSPNVIPLIYLSCIDIEPFKDKVVKYFPDTDN